MTRLRTGLDRTLGALLAVLVASAVLNVVWQVFSRFALANPSSFTDELSRYLLIWMGLVGAAYAAGQRRHVAVDLLPRDASLELRRRCDAVAEIAILTFTLSVLVFGGAYLVWLSFELGQRSAALALPLGVVYLALPFSGLATALYSVLHLCGVDREGP